MGADGRPEFDIGRRVHNFGAGPGTISTRVLHSLMQDFTNWRDTGMGLFEHSVRADYTPGMKTRLAEVEAVTREVLAVPDDYHVLFMHGGGHGQLDAVPLNLLQEPGAKADYLVTGYWSDLAATMATKYADVQRLCDAYGEIPPIEEWAPKVRKDAKYVYYCPNETVQGIEFPEEPDLAAVLGPDAPVLVADATSTLLSKPIDVSRFGVLFASAGKNLGPSGITLVLVRDDVLKRGALPFCPGVLSYAEAAGSKPLPNMYLTPPTFQLDVLGRILEDIKATGGLEAAGARASTRHAKLCAVIDGSDGFYTYSADARWRSRINTTLRIRGGEGDAPELERKFLEEADAAGLTYLAGRKDAGGLRVTFYDALPEAAVDDLCAFMTSFAAAHA